MSSEQKPIQTSRKPDEILRQSNDATIPARRAANASKRASITTDEPMSDDFDQDVEASIPKTLGHRKQWQQKQQRSADIAEEPEKATRGQRAPHSTSAPQNKSLSTPAQRRSGQPVIDPFAPRSHPQTHHHQTLSDSQVPENAWWQTELSGKVDGVSEDMKYVRRALDEMQYDRTERLRLQDELKETHIELKEAQASLEKTRTSLDAARKNWKKAALELGQLQSRGSGLYQLTDDYLVRTTQQLRYDINAFSVQYFSGQVPGKVDGFQFGGLWKYMLGTTPDSEDYCTHISSDTRCPIVIQSFIWRYLVGEIFGQFRWAPWLQDPVSQICQSLRPDMRYGMSGSKKPISHQDERQFQLWKATTSTLIIESAQYIPEEKVQNDVARYNDNLCQEVIQAISHLVQNSDDGLLDNFRHIVGSSIAFDKEICRQAARVDWVFTELQALVPFDPHCMEVETGQAEPEPGRHVQVVVAPGLAKRGKSTGEGFETASLLLKTEVFC